VETAAHLRRIGLLSGMLARAAGWTSGDVEFIRLAAPMHDVGKVGIPDSIIRKPGRLTLEEFDIMKMHTTIGATMLEGSEFPLLRMAREIALCHHERFNGSGYPAGLAGEAIPESARIVAIVDAYDSITHRRVYRPAMREDAAMCILADGHGTDFDPRLLELFFENLDEIGEISRTHLDDMAPEELLVS
jgi:putative two-component system response regulator